jgi:hypothetical protein
MQDAVDDNNSNKNIKAMDTLLLLKQTITSNSSWTPQFLIETTHFVQSGSSIIPNYDKKQKNTVNLTLFGEESISLSPVLSSFRSSVLFYPPNAVLEIEGFIGLDEERSVINMLKETAALGGTVLVVDSTRKLQGR